jgi:hypothetical protein
MGAASREMRKTLKSREVIVEAIKVCEEFEKRVWCQVLHGMPSFVFCLRYYNVRNNSSYWTPRQQEKSLALGVPLNKCKRLPHGQASQ